MQALRSVAFGSASAVRAARVAPFKMACAPVSRASAVVVRAAEEKKKATKKRTPAPVKRAMLAEERRMYNKARKSACATRIKKVIKLATTMLAEPPKSEADIKPMETLVAEAYKEIDKAVGKGVLHANNGARKKARIARWKRTVLMSAGLYTPAADSPDYRQYQRLQAQKASASA